MPFQFTKSRFLMCEGDDDKGFFEAMIRVRGLPEFQVCHAAECNEAGEEGKGVGGKSGFTHSLSGFRVITSFKPTVRAILIVTDNDTMGSFTDIQNSFTVNGHTPPSSPTQVGAVDGKLLMIPSHAHNGDLEKLCLPEIHRVWPDAQKCVDAFMTCTGAINWTRPASINKAKARAATVGFYEPDPYKGIGHLFRNGTLDTKNSCFDLIADFLRDFDSFVGIGVAVPAATIQPPTSPKN
jgi:hypothetical protein